MCYPTKNEYIKLSLKYNLIPVFKEYLVDTETPTSIFLKLGGTDKEMFLLESIEGEKNISRYSIIGVSYQSFIEFKDKIFVFNSKGNLNYKIKTIFPLLELEKIMKKYILYKNPDLDHFVGGAVGYLGYDLVQYFENINIKKSEDDITFPELFLYLTDCVIIFDHLLNRMKIISTILIDESNKNSSAEKTYNISVNKIKEIENLIFNNSNNNNGNIGNDNLNKSNHALNFTNFNYNINNFKNINIGKINNSNFASSNFVIKNADSNTKNTNKNNNFDLESDANINFISSNFSKENFIEAVKCAKKYITEGDIFQVVLSQRFSLKNISNPFNIYRALRAINPSPYMYYINFNNFKVIGSSPEPLLKINARKVSTYPIAGTRKRGETAKEDKILINELLNDEKEKAEHNMLVDLSRNDLGRVCKYGSVKVKKYMNIEKYSNVLHLVSRVEGILDKNKTIYDAIKSVFPAGTLSGAPKIRAMQIISELEPDRRNLYGGVIGYFGYDGSLNTCITIRTAVIYNETAYIQAGAGIVFDSEPQKEFEETINKAKALFNSISIANKININSINSKKILPAGTVLDEAKGVDSKINKKKIIKAK